MEQKKRQTPGGKAAKLWLGAMAAAFLAAAAIYVALLQAEKIALSEYEKAEAWLAAKDIPAGQLLTKENAEAFLTLSVVDAALVPGTALLSIDEASGLVATGLIEKGVILTKGMLQPVDEITKDMQEPVVAGFRAEDVSQVVGGVLRAGDRIHVYASDEEEGTTLIWENVYVQQVFDQSGNAIGNEDQETCAQRINVFLDKDEVEAFYTRLDQGSLRVVKIWRTERTEHEQLESRKEVP